MNTNNRQQNNNNRRRGRNNNNRQQNNNRNGFDYQNQIDNRARGNAAQMLEKYKKLAQDAQFNGDRVNAEYHLQFADHYFRVLADFRSRQEARQEQQGERRPRDEWRDQEREGSFEEMDSGEAAERESESEVNADDADEQPRRESRDNRPRRNDRNERGNRDGNRAPRRHHSEEGDDEPASLDLAVLPPSIALASSDEGDVEIEAVKSARKPRARRPKSANDEETATAAE
ncbi:DUF4167 domain-containing protein [Sphingorhabdus contaminans]|jgi:hypothetical protein|uniref:DUF4167 domain-containing protein n=1 Tax=Sphingorhabdus contaminans TaxID=1343899 RepID=UPI003D2A7321